MAINNWLYGRDIDKREKERKKEIKKEIAVNRLLRGEGGPSSAGHMAVLGGCGEGHQSNKACTIWGRAR